MGLAWMEHLGRHGQVEPKGMFDSTTLCLELVSVITHPDPLPLMGMMNHVSGFYTEFYKLL